MAAITLNDVRFSYLNVFQAKPPFNNPNGEAKFSTTILVPKTNLQAKALMEVANGSCDAAIIDMLMAGAMIGEGTAYADLVYSIELNSEEYGIGMRQGSDLVAALNTFLKTAYADGTIADIADTSNISDNVIAIN